MDLGDLIFPLIIIGSIIVQWLSSRKGDENEESPPDLPPQQRPTQSNDDNGAPSWDDLMEALGQPSAPPELPTTLPQSQTEPEFSPPPVPVYQEPERPAHVNLIERQKQQLEEKRRQLDLVKKQTKVRQPSSVAVADSRNLPERSLNLRQMLNNRKSLKQAIVLNEILQPPVSLR